MLALFSQVPLGNSEGDGSWSFGWTGQKVRTILGAVCALFVGEGFLMDLMDDGWSQSTLGQRMLQEEGTARAWSTPAVLRFCCLLDTCVHNSCWYYRTARAICEEPDPNEDARGHVATFPHETPDDSLSKSWQLIPKKKGACRIHRLLKKTFFQPSAFCQTHSKIHNGYENKKPNAVRCEISRRLSVRTYVYQYQYWTSTFM
jgi:hypothetical protein